jgi:membrane-associated phospholipid phosphatase
MKRISTIFLIFFNLLFFAQSVDSLGIQPNRVDFQYKKLYIPVALMVSGILTNGNQVGSPKNKIAQKRNELMPNFKNHIDDYAQLAPFAAVYGFELLGMKPKTDFRNRTAILIKGQILNLGMVYILKNSLKETRPDGTALSFPSGHTANVFAGATMLATEYGENYPWVPYASYGLASGVGAMRIANNRHYISDVLFGAGLGILSMKIAYWTHQYKWFPTKSTTDPFVGNIY